MNYYHERLIDPLRGLSELQIESAKDFYVSGEVDGYRSEVPDEQSAEHIAAVFRSHCYGLGIDNVVAVRALQQEIDSEGYL